MSPAVRGCGFGLAAVVAAAWAWSLLGSDAAPASASEAAVLPQRAEVRADWPPMVHPVPIAPVRQEASAPAHRLAPRGETPAPQPVLPYRYLGRVGEGADQAVVLFGNGRIVTLRGPGALDDEYAVDRLEDDYAVLRHIPTRAARVLEFALRQAATQAPASPDDSAQD